MSLAHSLSDRRAARTLVLIDGDADNQLRERGAVAPITELLRPFERRSAESRQAFDVRFISLNDLAGGAPIAGIIGCEQQLGVATDALQSVAVATDVPRTMELPLAVREGRTNDQLPKFRRMFARTVQESSPWFTQFLDEHSRLVGASQHEFFSHPAAVLLVVSARNEQLQTTVVHMFNQEHPPGLFRDYLMDSDLLRYCVFIDDASLGDELCAKRFEEVVGVLGKGHCVRIALREDARIESRGGSLVDVLSTDDMKSLHRFTDAIALRGIRPTLQKQCAFYGEFVAQRRSKVNKLQSWFMGSKSKAKRDQDSIIVNGWKGPVRALDIVTRRLADICFVLEDYDLALQHYKTASNDFKNEKNLKFFAACQEMIGICQFVLEQLNASNSSLAYRQREMVSQHAHMETAYKEYMRCGQFSCAMRVCLELYQMQLFRDELLLGAHTLIRAAEHDSCSEIEEALLNEQAALCYLMARPRPQLRRACYRLIVAACAYAGAHESDHALRCYSLAYVGYGDRNWTHIDDELNFVLGREYSRRGDTLLALSMMRRLLVKNGQDVLRQSTFLREFLQVYEDAKRTFELNKSDANALQLPELPIPHIDAQSVKVILQDSEPALRDWSRFADLERACVQCLQTTTRNADHLADGFRERWAALGNRTLDFDRERVAIVGESVYVHVRVRNPLHVAVQFTNVRLIAEHERLLPNGERVDAQERDSGASAPFTSDPVDVLLEGNDAIWLKIRIVVHQVGLLTIRGLAFTVCDQASGERSFQRDLPTPTPTTTLALGGGSKRSVPRAAASSVPRLLCASEMPLMEAELQSMPTHAYQGEVFDVMLVLRNCGGRALGGLKVAASHAHVFHFEGAQRAVFGPKLRHVRNGNGMSGGGGGGGSGGGGGGGGGGGTGGSKLKDGSDTDVFDLPLPDGRLKANGGEARIAVRVRAPQSERGAVEFCLVFVYEQATDDASSSHDVSLRYRVLRMITNMFVMPSLAGSVQQVVPMHGSTTERIVAFRLRNVSEHAVVRFHGVKCVGALIGARRDDDDGHESAELVALRSSIELSADSAARTTVVPLRRLHAEETVVLPGENLTLAVAVNADADMVQGADYAPVLSFDAAGDESGDASTLTSVAVRAPSEFNVGQFIFSWTIANSGDGSARRRGILQCADIRLFGGDESRRRRQPSIGRGAQNDDARRIRALTMRSSKAAKVCAPLDSLEISVSAPEKCAHSFGADGTDPCVLVVEVRVRNSDPHLPATAVVRALRPHEHDGNGHDAHFFFCGHTAQHVGPLAPGVERILRFAACLPTYGVYNVARFRLSGSGAERSVDEELLVHVSAPQTK